MGVEEGYCLGWLGGCIVRDEWILKDSCGQDVL